MFIQKPQTINEYFSIYSIEIQDVLKNIQKIIQQNVPNYINNSILFYKKNIR
jgi:hypothetical protein